MSRHENTSSVTRDVYATVTTQITDAIEKGVGTWRMPWHTSGQYTFSPINVTSRKAYRGINTLCLWAASEAKGYSSGEWGTYKQWQERGAQVRKGEKSSTVVFWKFTNEAQETQEHGEDHDTSASRLLFTRGYALFNAEQADGYVWMRSSSVEGFLSHPLHASSPGWSELLGTGHGRCAGNESDQSENAHLDSQYAFPARLKTPFERHSNLARS